MTQPGFGSDSALPRLPAAGRVRSVAVIHVCALLNGTLPAHHARARRRPFGRRVDNWGARREQSIFVMVMAAGLVVS